MFHRKQMLSSTGWREWALALLLIGMAGVGMTGLAQPGGDATAELVASPEAGKAPLEVVFEIAVGPASSSDCPADSYILDFGDNTEPAVGGSNGPFMVRHTYTNLGIFKAKLSYTTSINVGIAAPNCQADDATAELSISVMSAEPLRFVGDDGNWFDPENWDQGRVPGPDDDVLLDGDTVVIVDPEKDPTAAQGGGGGVGKVSIQDVHFVTLQENARLETLPGTRAYFDALIIFNNASFVSQSSVITGEELTLNGSGAGPNPCNICELNPEACTGSNGGSGGLFFGTGGKGGDGAQINPTYMHFDSIKGESSMLTFLLGGTIAASPIETGPEHYPVLAGDEITLNDLCLNIEAIDDFQPSVGDEFRIIEATGTKELTGTLILAQPDGTTRELEDGDSVARFGDVVLDIRYEPNAVVLLTRKAQNVWRGSDPNWFDPSNWSEGNVPGQFDDVVIPENAQVRLEDQSVKVASIYVQGQLDLVSACLDTKLAGWGYPSSTVKLNPSCFKAATIEHAGEPQTLIFGLGGTDPVTAGDRGEGHYATLSTENLSLDGIIIDVKLFYDFQPSIGDEFVIIQASEGISGKLNSIDANGTLRELNEGDEVATFGEVGLFISYIGGTVTMKGDFSRGHGAGN